MSSNKLRLTLVIAASLLALAACDRSGKKAADTQTPAAPVTAAMNAPAASTPMSTPAPDASGKTGSVREACADDIKKFCADADKPFRCQQEHQAQLSQACTAARAARKAAREAEQSKQ